MCKAGRPSYAKVTFATEDGIFERSLAFSLPAPLYLNVENNLNHHEAAAVNVEFL